MKVGQLIECNMRNISFEKSYTNVMEKVVPDPLLRNYNWAYLWINDQEFYTVFLLYNKRGLSKYIETKVHTTCFYLLLGFLKNKKRSGTSLPFLIFYIFLKKNISLVIFY